MAVIFGASEMFLLVTFGHLSLAALVFAPCFLRKDISLVDPLNLVVLYIIVGAVIPVYFVAFNQTPRIQYMMAGRFNYEFLYGASWFVISAFLIGVGNTACRSRVRAEYILPLDTDISVRGVQFALVAGVAISALSILVYIQQTGGLSASISDISRKRAIEVISNGEVVYAGAGYVNMTKNISIITVLVTLPYYLARYTRVPRVISYQLWALVVLALTVPFLSSSRSGAVFVILGILIALSVRDRLTIRIQLISAMAIILGFLVMTALRTTAQQSAEFSLIGPLSAFAESGNGLSIVGTSHIIMGVPERMDYQLGSTYFSWVFAPIPRTIWPSKPDISLGKRVKAEVLQQSVIRTGRPASFMGEGWINFGPIGFLISSLLFGYVLRLIGNSLLPIIKERSFAVPLFYTLSLNTAALTNAALSQGIVWILSDVAVIIFVYLIIRYSFGRKPAYRNLQPTPVTEPQQ
tara:strand:+ start:771 stop:2165 length:1395 start_codon:yes stop_codon:yes gene_type:complete